MEELENQFSEIASIIGDKVRAVMLWFLLDGRAYTARELAICANVSPQSASNHLLKLVNAHVLAVEKQGRHRYYTYANPEVAQVVESMASLVTLSPAHKRKERPQLNEFTHARTCYDHLAGKVAVQVTDALLKKGVIAICDKAYEVTPYGQDWFTEVGVPLHEVKLQKRSFAHQCLDWSERKHHIAGALGASLLEAMCKNDWIRRKKNTREVSITSLGKQELKNRLNIQIAELT